MKIDIQIDAVPQGRPRFYRGRTYDPPQSKQFKKDLATLVNSLDNSAFYTGELKLKIDIYRDKKSVTSRRYGDIDNLVKAILDGLNGVLWQDDKQISDLHVTKNLSGTPHIVIDIEEVTDD